MPKREEREKGEGKRQGERSQRKRASRQEVCKGRRREKRESVKETNIERTKCRAGKERQERRQRTKEKDRRRNWIGCIQQGRKVETRRGVNEKKARTEGGREGRREGGTAVCRRLRECVLLRDES